MEAQQACDWRDKIADMLAAKYKEAPTATGIASRGSLVEVFTTKDHETWTIIITNTKGWSCIAAAGEAWREIEFELEPNA